MKRIKNQSKDRERNLLLGASDKNDLSYGLISHQAQWLHECATRYIKICLSQLRDPSGIKLKFLHFPLCNKYLRSSQWTQDIRKTERDDESPHSWLCTFIMHVWSHYCTSVITSIYLLFLAQFEMRKKA